MTTVGLARLLLDDLDTEYIRLVA